MDNLTSEQEFKDAVNALKIAKITMMMQRDTTFYTAILFSLKQKITDEIPTAATDGKNLLLNPTFFSDLSINERITLLAHEVLHVALDHMHRRDDRDPKLWNMAADYVINYCLVKADYTLPKGGLYDAKYANMTTEQVYALLDKKSEQEKQSLVAQAPEDIQYPEDAKDPGSAVTQDEVTDIVLTATTQAKAMGQDPGSIPSEIDINLQRTLNPPLPWNIILQNYLTEFKKDDYTFKRPNRRFMPDYYLPTAHSEAICNLAFCVDCSSSVSDEEFNDYITKIYEIKKMLKPTKITIMSFNTKFMNEQELQENEDPFQKLKFNGRGGTRIEPAHEWIAKNKPTVAIIFTDGLFGQTKPHDPRIPIVWTIYDNPQWKCEYNNRVIHYALNE